MKNSTFVKIALLITAIGFASIARASTDEYNELLKKGYRPIPKNPPEVIVHVVNGDPLSRALEIAKAQAEIEKLQAEIDWLRSQGR